MKKDLRLWCASAAKDLVVLLHNSLLNVDYAKALGCVR